MRSFLSEESENVLELFQIWINLPRQAVVEAVPAVIKIHRQAAVPAFDSVGVKCVVPPQTSSQQESLKIPKQHP